MTRGPDLRCSIYHYHLKKCGGTSLNAWLAGLVADDQVWEPRRAANVDEPPGERREVAEASHAEIRASLAGWRLVCSHSRFLDLLPDETVKIVVLRDPVSRILSQVSDWRREAVAQRANTAARHRDLVSDSLRLDLAGFLTKHARSSFRYFFDDYLTRSLSGSFVGAPKHPAPVTPADLEEAIRTLSTRFHVVGLTERMAQTRVAIAAELGRPPDVDGGTRLNVTDSEALLAAEVPAALDILAELTKHDRVLYREAVAIFETRHGPTIARYDEASFEATHAHDMTVQMSPQPRGPFVVHSVRDEMLASGFQGRDGAGTPSCRMWSGSGPRSVLYMPVPVGQDVEVRLWVHGFAATSIPEGLVLELDEIPVPAIQALEEGWHCTISVRTVTRRPFVKICMTVPQTFTSVEAGYGEGDNRRRGVSIDSYGWRSIDDETVQ